MNKRHQINLDFSEAAFNRLDAIRTAAGASSNAEVIRKALLVYDWFLNQKKKDNKIQVIEGNIINEISFIF